MMDIPGFTTESLQEVTELLYAEGNPYEGKCGQKKLRKQNQDQRTPAQQEADKRRSQEMTGKAKPSANRQEAAKKAAETRKKCKGQATQGHGIGVAAPTTSLTPGKTP